MSEKQDKINKLLADEDELSKYLDKIENIEIKIPPNLEINISNNIKIIKEINRKNKTKFMDIVKVACFALVSVLSWEIGINKLSNVDYLKTQEKTTVFSYKEDAEGITNKLGKFMMSDIIKGGKE